MITTVRMIGNEAWLAVDDGKGKVLVRVRAEIHDGKILLIHNGPQNLLPVTEELDSTVDPVIDGEADLAS